MNTDKKSPFTGGAVELCMEQETTRFRNEVFSYTSYYYRCLDTGRRYTDNELDDKSLGQVYNQYRKRHGIPSSEEIRAIRTQYGLSALSMARILGLGDNQYRLYEDGTIPTESAGKLISLARQKKNMLALLEASIELFPPQEYSRLLGIIGQAPQEIIKAFETPIHQNQPLLDVRSGRSVLKKIVDKQHFKKERYADTTL